MPGPFPIALQGPPPPATMSAVAGLDSTQLERYRAAYRAHMVRTLATREDVADAMAALRAAVDRGDGPASRQYGTVAGELWEELLAEDGDFDAALRTILRADQLRRYTAWRSGGWPSSLEVRDRGTQGGPSGRRAFPART